MTVDRVASLGHMSTQLPGCVQVKKCVVYKELDISSIHLHLQKVPGCRIWSYVLHTDGEIDCWGWSYHHKLQKHRER